MDKPWALRVAQYGTAWYKRNDGETHKWWWDEYERWRRERREKGEERLLETVEKHVARPRGEEGSSGDEDTEDIGVKVQAMASNKKHEGQNS